MAAMHEPQKSGERGGAREKLRTVAPPVDIYDQDEALHLRADLPGVGTDDLRIDVNRDVLTIEATFAGEDVFVGAPDYSELRPIRYYRAFVLGEDLDPARITATVKDGVLELAMPKADRARTRKIRVEQG